MEQYNPLNLLLGEDTERNAATTLQLPQYTYMIRGQFVTLPGGTHHQDKKISLDEKCRN
jgi:hypothetical protein